MRSKGGIFAFVALCLVETAYLYACTQAGVGIGPDTTIYYGAAQNLLAGRGLLMPYIDIPMTHFPPLFPLILAAGGLVGLPLLAWARWVNLLAAAGSLVLALLLSKRLAPGLFLLAVLLIATSRSFSEIHLAAWSESTYIFLSAAAAWLLSLHLEKPRPGLLAQAGLLCGLAWLDRYIGLALFLAMGVVIWNSSPRRWRDLLLYGIPAALPTAGWLAFNALAAGSAVDRRIQLLPITAVEAGITVGLALFGLAAHRFLRGKASAGALDLLALYLFFYGALLGFTISLADPDTLVLDFRMLAPVFFFLYLLLPPFIERYARRKRLFLAALAAIILLQALYLVSFTRAVAAAGLMEATGEWRWGEIYIPPHDWR